MDKRPLGMEYFTPLAIKVGCVENRRNSYSSFCLHICRCN